MRYVREHYADTNLSVSSVAEFFGVNPFSFQEAFAKTCWRICPDTSATPA
jgi:hypothetical protein